MALKVWLPLSGDTTNYGLSDATVELAPSITFGAGILGGGSANTSEETKLHGTFSANISSKMSISAWVNEGYSSTGNVLLAIQIGTTDVALLEKTATGYKIASLVNEDLFTLPSGWNHIAVTADGTTVKSYLNGTLVKEVAQTGTIATASLYNLTIGGKTATGNIDDNVIDKTFSNAWNGSICALKIYDSIVSQFEVANEANGLVLNYSFNGIVSLGTGITLPSGTTAETFGFGDKEYDLSGNGFDGSFGSENRPTSSTDTAMYSASMNFAANNTGVTSAEIRTGEISSRYTITVWAKGVGAIAKIGNWTAVSANDSEKWHFIATTSGGNIYVDGVDTGDKVVGSMPVGLSQFVIGPDFVGKLSDFRVYAKAMSAAEILALYKRKAAIDTSGQLIATEFIVDNEISAPSFSSKGVVSVAALGNWTGESDSPVDVTTFAISQTTGAVNATDVMEF